MCKVCAKTGVAFCGATSDGPATETRLPKIQSTKRRRPLRTGGSAAAAVAAPEEEEEDLL